MDTFTNEVRAVLGLLVGPSPIYDLFSGSYLTLVRDIGNSYHYSFGPMSHPHYLMRNYSKQRYD